MAVLILEFRNKKRAAQLPARVLIGRRSMNHLVIDDPAVSRMHAWIDQLGADFYLTDMHSRTGTRINGQPVAHQQQQLNHGDVIEIGPAKLTFKDVGSLPLGVEPLELPAVPVIASHDVGIRFDCPQCTAPLWAGVQFARHVGECAYCREGFTVPMPAATTAPAKVSAPLKATAPAKSVATTTVAAPPRIATPVAARPAPAAAPKPKQDTKPPHSQRCGVCQSPILPLEARTTCPACGLLFHDECWQENYGCSAYGCSQVNVLKPPEPETAADAGADQHAAAVADVDPPARTPWEFILLGASALAVLLSAVSFGGASVLALLAAIVYWMKGKKDPEQKRGPIVGAMALSVVGIAAGIALSYYLFIYSGGWRR